MIGSELVSRVSMRKGNVRGSICHTLLNLVRIGLPICVLPFLCMCLCVLYDEKLTGPRRQRKKEEKKRLMQAKNRAHIERQKAEKARQKAEKARQKGEEYKPESIEEPSGGGGIALEDYERKV